MIKVPDKIGGLPTLFIATVLLPTIFATIYYTVKSDVYVSESRFVVQSSEKPQSIGLSGLFKAGGFSNSSEQALAANDYIKSRDALTTLNRDGLVRNAYSRNDISVFDRFNPLGNHGGRDDLFKFYQDMVIPAHDSGSGITTLTVKAFTPQDAQTMNLRLMVQAEDLVNRMNERGRKDVIDSANTELNDAKTRAREAALALSHFRNREGIVDPEQQATAQLQMISKLQDEVIATKTQLVQLRSLTPQNPQIRPLELRIAELDREIATQLGQIAGNQKSLAATAVQFQRLQLESQLADKELAAAISSLQEARNEARRKRAYVERIVEPNLPDIRSEPKRIFGILNVLVVGLVLWGIFSMVVAGIREHTD